jgi:hypothetical protein
MRRAPSGSRGTERISRGGCQSHPARYLARPGPKWGRRLVPPSPGFSGGPVARGGPDHQPGRPDRYEQPPHLDRPCAVVGEERDPEDRADQVHGSREEIGAAGITGAVRFKRPAGWGSRRAPSRRGSRRGRGWAGGWSVSVSRSTPHRFGDRPARADPPGGARLPRCCSTAPDHGPGATGRGFVAGGACPVGLSRRRGGMYPSG